MKKSVSLDNVFNTFGGGFFFNEFPIFLMGDNGSG